MATLAQIREAMRVRLATISGLNAYAYMVPDPELPGACVIPVDQANAPTFDGGPDGSYRVWIYVGVTDMVEAQMAIDAYLDKTGTRSIAAALEAVPSLGGLVSDVTVTGFNAYAGPVEIGSHRGFAAAIEVKVLG